MVPNEIYKSLLNDIENVNPEDSMKLKRIEENFHRFLHGSVRPVIEEYRIKQVTNSRDALKDVRPHGWYPIGFGKCGYGESEIGMGAFGFVFSLYKPDPFRQDGFVKSKYLPTEELAELHAIVQAIAYERGY